MNFKNIKNTNFFLWLVIFTSCLFGQSQNNSYDPYADIYDYKIKSKSATSAFAYFSDLKQKGKQHSYFKLSDDLTLNVPIPDDVACRFEVGFFVFRVNQLGVVDFIDYQGNLLDTIRNQILINIKNTKGHWYLPKNSKSKYRFFEYTFYSEGNHYPKKCPESKSFDELYAFRLKLETFSNKMQIILSKEGNLTIIPSGTFYKEMIRRKIVEPPKETIKY